MGAMTPLRAAHQAGYTSAVRAQVGRREFMLGAFGFFMMVAYGAPFDLTTRDGSLRFALSFVILGAAFVGGQRQRRARGCVPLHVALLVTLFGLILVSTVWTPDPGYAAWKVVAFASRAVAPTLAIWLMRPSTSRDVTAVLAGALVGSLIVVGRMVLVPQQFAVWRTRYTIETFTHPNAVARDIGVALVLLTSALIFRARSKGLTVLVPAALAGAVIAVLRTGSRGPVVAYVVALLFAWVVAGAKNRRLIAVTLAVTLAGAAAAIRLGAFGLSSDQLGSTRIAERGVLELVDAGDRDGVERLLRFSEAWEMFTESGMAGVGLGGFSALYSGPPPGGIFSDRQYPHNLFLEIASEVGLAALMLIAALVAVWLWSASRLDNVLDAGPSFALAAMTMYALVNASVSGDLGTNNLVFVCGALSATCWRMANVDARRGNSELHPGLPGRAVTAAGG
jgi:O-antigen ligase